MNVYDISPILGLDNIDPNKRYTYKRLVCKSDSGVLGRLIIKTSFSSNVYLFKTKIDEDTNLLTSYERIFAGETIGNTIEVNISESEIEGLVLVTEYNPQVISETEELPLEITTSFEAGIVDVNSDFVTYSSKSGIPYPSNQIGLYSRYEFEVDKAGRELYSYENIGILYNNITNNTLQFLVENIIKLVRLLSNIYNINIIEDNIVFDENLEYKNNLSNNANNIADFISKNKIILLIKDIRDCLTKIEDEESVTAIEAVLQEIENENDFDVIISSLADELLTLTQTSDVKLQEFAEKIKNISEEQEAYRISIKELIDNVLTDDDITADEATNITQELGLINSNQIIKIEKQKKILAELKVRQPISGHLTLNGDSKFTGAYASSKILVGHHHENERGYLRRVLATDKYGKSHKDAFVKNREQFGLEEDYIYLDLLENSKNTFANSAKILSSVALLEAKPESELPKGKVIFNFVNTDTGIIFDTIEKNNVYYYDCYAPLVKYFLNGVEIENPTPEQIQDDNFISLTLLNDSVKRLIIPKEDAEVSFNFNYTARSANFYYKFVDENGNEIKQTEIVYKQPFNSFYAPLTINSQTPGSLIEDKLKTYALIEPKGEIYQEAETTHDEFTTIFKYKLIMSDFEFRLIYGDTKELIDNIKTVKIIEDNGETKEYNISDLQAPYNSNPIIFKNASNITYRAPLALTTINYLRYKVYGISNFIELQANLGQSTIINLITYKIVKSKFKIYFIDESTGEELLPSINFPENTKITYSADEIIQKSTGEYYVLTDRLLATQTISAHEDKETVEYKYMYKPLTGTVTINYVDEDNELLDLSDTVLPMVFTDITSMDWTAPDVINRAANVKYILLTTPAAQHFAITPDNENIEFTYVYHVEATAPQMGLYTTGNTNNTNTIGGLNFCAYKTGIKFILLSSTNTVINKFDFVTAGTALTETKELSYYGLNVRINCSVYDTKYNNIIHALNPSNDTGSDYGLVVEGIFSKNPTIKTPQTLRLVVFVSAHDEHSNFYLCSPNSGVYGSKNIYNQEIPIVNNAISFYNSLRVGDTFEANETNSLELLEINLDKIAEEEVFIINPAIARDRTKNIVTLDINNLK